MTCSGKYSSVAMPMLRLQSSRFLHLKYNGVVTRFAEYYCATAYVVLSIQTFKPRKTKPQVKLAFFRLQLFVRRQGLRFCWHQQL